MSENNVIEEPQNGCLFADPRTISEEYKPAKTVFFKKALEYAKRVRAEENRDVTMEEMEQFAIRESHGEKQDVQR